MLALCRRMRHLVASMFYVQFRQTPLAIVGAFLEPVTQIIAITTIWTIIGREARIPGVSMGTYIVSGMIVFVALRQTATAMMANRPPLRFRGGFVPIPLLHQLIAHGLMLLVTQAVSFTLFIVCMIMLNIADGADDIFWFMLVVGYAWLVGFLLGVFLGYISKGRVWVRTVFTLTFWAVYFMSGVIIPVTRFPPDIQHYLINYNPLYTLVVYGRDAYVSQYVAADVVSIHILITLAVVALLFFWAYLNLVRSGGEKPAAAEETAATVV